MKPDHKAPSRGGERGDERGEELTQRISITAHKATARGDEGGDQPRQRISKPATRRAAQRRAQATEFEIGPQGTTLKIVLVALSAKLLRVYLF